MSAVIAFDEEFAQEFPETYRLLADSNLILHEYVERISLHGSRGPAQNARVDSDIDLCLHVSVDPVMPEDELDYCIHYITGIYMPILMNILTD